MRWTGRGGSKATTKGVAGKEAKTATKKRQKEPSKAPPAAPLVQPGKTPVVFLDANVLLPEYIRAVFLDLADAGLIEVNWSADVLLEVRRNLEAKFGLTAAKADRLVTVLQTAFPGSLVQGYLKHAKKFIGSVHSGDKHVAAAAYKLSIRDYAGRNIVLVSHNLKHLPKKAFVDTTVLTSRPGPFLEKLIATKPGEVSSVLKTLCARMTKPPISEMDLLTLLENSDCKGFAAKLAEVWGFAPAS